jgi:hypothetical protein
MVEVCGLPRREVEQLGLLAACGRGADEESVQRRNQQASLSRGRSGDGPNRVNGLSGVDLVDVDCSAAGDQINAAQFGIIEEVVCGFTIGLRRS